MTQAREDRRDRKLLRDLAAGKAAALGALYDRHAASLLRHALALTRQRGDAEDLVHAVFLKLSAVGAPLLGVRSPASYLHRMLHATWVDGRRRAIVDDRVVNEIAGASDSGAYAPDDAIDFADALARLPVEQGEVVVLHVVEGFSFREIGGLTGVSMFTAAARYRLAIAKLRATLEPLVGERT